MTLIEIPAQLTLPSLFQAIEQLSADDLDSLVAHAQSIRLRFTDEEKLLTLVNQRLPPDEMQHLHMLSQKLEDETISESENAELLMLVQKNKELDAQRVEALVALAHKRGVPVKQLVEDLQLDHIFG